MNGPMPIQPRWCRKTHRTIAGYTILEAVIVPHNQQAMRNHCGQDLEHLRCRGGLSACEALAIIEDRKWTPMDQDEADAKLKKLIEEGKR